MLGSYMRDFTVLEFILSKTRTQSAVELHLGSYETSENINTRAENLLVNLNLRIAQLNDKNWSRKKKG